MKSANPSTLEFHNTRILPFSAERIYAAFADPAVLARWWGPAGFTNTIHEFDLRAGGTWLLDMHGPDGTLYPNTWRFVEIAPAERVVLEHSDPVHVFTLTISLTPENDGTRVDWHMRFVNAADFERAAAYVPDCNEQNLDRLTAVLSENNPPH